METFKEDVNEMFLQGTQDNRNKIGTRRMAEYLRAKYPGRIDLPSESEIRQRISSLFTKFKKQGYILVLRRGIPDEYRDTIVRII